MINRRKTNRCIDCGALIYKFSIRCVKCANSGKNNPNWKGGLPKCIRCGKQLSDYRATYCPVCLMKYKHPALGYKHTEESKKRLSKARMDENNPNWKGDGVGYGALHRWVASRKPKPALCECCKKVLPYDLANISQKYIRDLDDWEWLCRACHMKKDGRLKVLCGKYNLKIKKGGKNDNKKI